MKKRKKIIKLDTELDDLFDEASEVSSSTEISSNSTVAKSDEVLRYTITENDNEFSAALKTLINSLNITHQDLYNQKKQRDGYNMAYSLDKQLGMVRFKSWCRILGYKFNITFTKMTEEEHKEALAEEAAIAAAKKAKKTKRR